MRNKQSTRDRDKGERWRVALGAWSAVVGTLRLIWELSKH
jgi:hypothetical protein